MQTLRPKHSGAFRAFRPLCLWCAIGILLACAWHVMAADVQPDTTNTTAKTASPQNLLLADSLKAATVTFPNGISALTSEEKPDPNLPPPDWVTPYGDSTYVLEDFTYPKNLGSFPEDVWEGRAGLFYSKVSEKDVYYRIQKEEDNFYLSAQTTGKAVNFGRNAVTKFRGREFNANLRLHQKLRWRWRVHSLPEGADERDSDKNDSAAAVRIIFNLSLRGGKAIKYIWSATLPVGKVIDNGGLKVIVLESGPEKLGQWVWEEVNAYEDYRRLFGGDPRSVEALGLLTDSNNTESLAKADYDDITFIIPRPSTVEMVPDFMLEDK